MSNRTWQYVCHLFVMVPLLFMFGVTFAAKYEEFPDDPNGMVQPRPSQPQYTAAINSVTQENILNYLDLSLFFGMPNNQIYRFTNGSVACDRCSNNKMSGLIDALMLRSGLNQMNPALQKTCSRGIPIDEYQTPRPPQKMVGNGRAQSNDPFWIHNTYHCQGPPIPSYVENRMLADPDSKFGRESVSDKSCSIATSNDQVSIIVDGKALSFPTQRNTWTFYTSEFVDFPDTSEFVPVVHRVQLMHSIDDVNRFSRLDLRIDYKEPISHAQNEQVKHIVSSGKSPFYLLSIELEQSAVVGLRLYQPDSGTNLSCALHRGKQGFNDYIQMNR